MVDAQESSEGDVRFVLESLRRDVACLTREVRQMKAALFKLRGSAAESSGGGEVDASPRGRKEEGSTKAPLVAADVEELGTAVFQSQYFMLHLGEDPGKLRNLNMSNCWIGSIYERS